MRKKSVKQKRDPIYHRRARDIAAALDIPINALTDDPRIEVFGMSEVIVENHRGVLRYEEDNIKVNCGSMIVTIEGSDLFMKAMDAANLAISGVIRIIGYDHGLEAKNHDTSGT